MATSPRRLRPPIPRSIAAAALIALVALLGAVRAAEPAAEAAAAAHPLAPPTPMLLVEAAAVEAAEPDERRSDDSTAVRVLRGEATVPPTASGVAGRGERIPSATPRASAPARAPPA